MYNEDRLHPNYLYVLKEDLPFSKEVIENWAEGFIDRDKKFVKEFQTTFNSSFWELYLFAVLKELGLSVNMDYDRPDFVVESEEKGFVVEATIANHPNTGTPEWERHYSAEEIAKWPINRILDNATLRLANSFISKSRKYNDYNKLEYVKGKPYVIAISPFDQPFFFAQNHQAIQRVLYGFDRYIAIDWDDTNRELFDAVFMENIVKNNGSKVPLGYFNNKEHAHVSAVIFSNVATFSKVRVLSEDPRITLVYSKRYNYYGTQPLEQVEEKSKYYEHLLDGLVVFHNPNANIPFNIEEFYHPIIGHYGFDVESDEFLVDIPHGTLFQRNVSVLNIPNASTKKLDNIRRDLSNGAKNKNSTFPIIHD